VSGTERLTAVDLFGGGGFSTALAITLVLLALSAVVAPRYEVFT